MRSGRALYRHEVAALRQKYPRCVIRVAYVDADGVVHVRLDHDGEHGPQPWPMPLSGAKERERHYRQRIVAGKDA